MQAIYILPPYNKLSHTSLFLAKKPYSSRKKLDKGFFVCYNFT